MPSDPLPDHEEPRVPPDSSGSELRLGQDAPMNRATSLENVGKSQEAASPADTFCGAYQVSDRRLRKMTKTSRVDNIEMLIRNRRHVSFPALLHELDVSPATL